MLQEDRFLIIIEYLKEHNISTFAELAEAAGASVGTIRRDLAKLEEKGMLSVIRGGAAYHKDDLTKQVFDMRKIENRKSKHALVERLSEIIVDGQAIAINSGTTNMEVAGYLVENYHRLTVMTNNLHVLDILKQNEGFRLLVPGGILRNDEHAIYGKKCEEEIRFYNLDVALLAVNSVSTEKGITDFRPEEVGVIRAMMDASEKKVVMADHTKFDRVSYMNVCDLSEIDYIITDKGIRDEQVKRYEAEDVKIMVSGDKAE